MITADATILTNMKDKIEKLAVSPVFFIGSGISKRYFHAPDWIGLLREIRETWDRSFDYYLQGYKKGNNYELDRLAEYLCEMYYEKLTDEELEPDKDKVYYFKKRVAEIVNHYLYHYIESFESYQEIIDLKKTSPSAIITTNYDTFLEKMFPDYDVYIGQQSLLSTNLGAVGEIYKIHGCVTDIDSIVITESDYKNYEERELYLNAKLLTLFLEYPIIFLGYSLNDKNVLSTLTSIIKMLPFEKVEELSKRIWFIRRSSDGDYSRVERINLGEGLFIDVETIYLTDYSKLYNLLSSSKIQKLPIKFLKYLKSNVYKLAASQVYNPKLLNVNLTDIHKVNDFESMNNIIGLSFSTDSKYKKEMLSRRDIIEPILHQENCEYSEAALKYIFQQNNTQLPIHYFTRNFEPSKLEKIIQSVEGNERTKSAIKAKINTKQNYVINIGINNNYNFSPEVIKSVELSMASVGHYMDEFCESNAVPYSSANTVLRYFMLEILNNRLTDLINSDDFLVQYRKDILQSITNLTEQFIKENIGELLILLKKLDTQSYESEFRKVVCLVDQCIYSELS